MAGAGAAVLKVLAGLDLLLVVEPDHVELAAAANVGGQRHRLAVRHVGGLDVVGDAGRGVDAVDAVHGRLLLLHGQDGHLQISLS